MTINTVKQETRYNFNFDSRRAGSAAQGKNNVKDNPAECETCAERKYQDKSDDPGVSFKMAARVSGKNSVAAVLGHEREHETRESQKADIDGEYVVYSRIRIKMAQCPECKKMYSSGGETEVVKSNANSVWAAQINFFKQAQDLIYGSDTTGLLLRKRV